MFIRILLTFCLATASFAAVIGQIDDFEDGTTMGWFVPDPSHPAPPENVASGGPAGDDDNYLRLTATGAGMAGSRMAVLNETQWSGNYISAGIGGIAMHVRNFGPDELHLRLLFEAFGDIPFTPPEHLALSAEPVIVPAGSDWMRVLFPVTAGALVSGGLGTVQGALLDVDTLRIFHNPAPTFPGPGAGIPQVNAVLGVDNIEAVPEPGTWLLTIAGLSIILLKRKA